MMTRGAICSALLHAAVIAFLIIGLPSFVDPLEPMGAISVDYVTEEDLAAAEKPATQQEESKDPPQPKPKPVQQVEAPSPPPPPIPESKPAPEPVPDPESLPEPVADDQPEAPPAPPPTPEPEPEIVEPEPEPEPVPQALPKEAPKEIAKAPPQPKRKPKASKTQLAQLKEKEPEKPKEKDRLKNILKNVLKDQTQSAQQPAVQAATAESSSAAAGASVIEQMAIVRAIQGQMRRCWRIEPGARKAEEMIVEIDAVLNPDGSVRKADIVDQARMGRDPYFRSAAENARRAILKCSPFNLPADKFAIWRAMRLQFNPKDMFG